MSLHWVLYVLISLDQDYIKRGEYKNYEECLQKAETIKITYNRIAYCKEEEIKKDINLYKQDKN
jgi:hypothetical protein